jgi:hypothetical protein
MAARCAPSARLDYVTAHGGKQQESCALAGIYLMPNSVDQSPATGAVTLANRAPNHLSRGETGRGILPIRYRRGHIQILDRTALEELSLSAMPLYGVTRTRFFRPQKAFDRNDSAYAGLP